ncbi:hypothetical protein QBC37DRAFT_108927 [Rhypophila decipiens]|uniref:Secreted protein n=1 Tax=Rhypophila decipiens TaxID=261697 RepID=A0AAN6YJJ5_9PEZI|nr:hypothetical protein QBC37DRAFT_108927 [Rhypophila decipiens]
MVASIHASGAQPSPIPFHRPLFLLLVIRLVFCFFLDPSCQVLVHPRSTAKPNVCHIASSKHRSEVFCPERRYTLLLHSFSTAFLSSIHDLTFSYSPSHFPRLVLAETPLAGYPLCFVLAARAAIICFLSMRLASVDAINSIFCRRLFCCRSHWPYRIQDRWCFECLQPSVVLSVQTSNVDPVDGLGNHHSCPA